MEALNIVFTVVGCLISAGLAGIGLFSFGALAVKELRK